ncbi:MAG: PKD domain-containing protein [Verrucomicrobiales bacterium]|nr:PKD domain-containing protein [Verrucomicrobiales bacterium]
MAVSLLAPRETKTPGKLDNRAASSNNAQASVSSSPSFDPDGFREWLISLDGKPLSAQREKIPEGMRHLQGRRQWMARLIRSNPERALREALTYEQRSLLPDSLLGHIEKPLSAAATYEVEIACSLGTGGSKTTRLVTLDDGRQLEAFTFGRRLQVTCKDRISIHGIESEGVAAIDPHPVRLLGTAEQRDRGLQAKEGSHAEILGKLYTFSDPARMDELGESLVAEELIIGPSPGEAYLELMSGGEIGAGNPGDNDNLPALKSNWTEGTKDLLYMRVQFSDDDPERVDLSYEKARSRQDDVEEFLKINSYGKCIWNTTITDVIRLENTHNYYRQAGWSQMLNDARALARDLGEEQGEDWDYDNYNFYTVVSRGGFGSYAGIAQVGGRRSHLVSTSLRTAGHEFGHNLGLSHAYYNYTKSLNPRGTSTYEGLNEIEYAHRFSIMSDESSSDFNNPALPHFTVHEKWQLDWLEGNDILNVTDASDNGTHRLYQNDLEKATGLRAIRLPSGGARSHYWVSYRAAWTEANRGSDQDYLLNGAVFDWTGSGGGRSTLLDMTPYSDDGPHSGSRSRLDNSDKWDAPLAIGRTYSDYQSGVHLTPVARGGSAPDEYLDIFVHFDEVPPVTWIDDNAPCRAIAPGLLDPRPSLSQWTAPLHDDSSWRAGRLGVGYERSSGFNNFIRLDLESQMYDEQSSAYIRIPFEIDSVDDLELRRLTLQLRYDDGFIAYINGTRIASANAPDSPSWNSGATRSHSDSDADDFEDFDASRAIDQLVPGTNVLAIHGLNNGDSSSDFLIQPRLIAYPASSANRAPEVTLSASSLNVARGAEVVFTAEGTDPDDDVLAYSWHFGEGDDFIGEGLNSPSARKSWNQSGDYLVRLTCSDRKGKTATSSLVITVGNPSSNRRIQGRVLKAGIPISGARVWTGNRQTWTGSDGTYILAGLPAGSYRISAQSGEGPLVSFLPNPITPDPVTWNADFLGHGQGTRPAALTISPFRTTLTPGQTIRLTPLLWQGAGQGTTVVPFGSNWRYLDDGSNQGTQWRSPEFDDSGWDSGPAQLGYGEGDEATTLSAGDDDDRHITSYFRHAFDVADPGAINSCRVRVVRDDAIVIYLNGTEIARENITSGTVSSNSEARNEVSGSAEDEILLFAFEPSLLLEGSNVLAAEVHQVDPQSSDMSFDLELSLAGNVTPVNPEWSVGEGATIDEAGNFTATLPGLYRATAQLDGLSASAEIGVASDVTVSINTSRSVISEAGETPASFIITRSDASGTLEVGLSLAGSVTVGEDFLDLPGSVTFADGESSVELPLRAIDDAAAEPTETLTLGTIPSLLYSPGSPAVGTIRIEDNDFINPPTVSIDPPADGIVNLTLPLRAEAQDTRLLVAQGGAWRYSDTGALPSSWRQRDFDDSEWKSGFAPLGYGESDVVTEVSDGGSPKNITTYFRRSFVAGEGTPFTSLTMRLRRDDGAIVYLNGNEIHRSNMPGGNITANTRASGSVSGSNEDRYYETDLSGVDPLPGINVIAVEIHQVSPTSSDIIFDMQLFARLPPSTLQWEKVSGPGNVTFSDPFALDTGATFDRPGTYVVRLVAGDGLSQGSSLQTINVDPPPSNDADSDGLLNDVETNTGIFLSAQDTGTDPDNPDTDGDGWLDGDEVSLGTSPVDGSDAPSFELSAAITVLEEGGVDQFTLSFPASSNSTYSVEASADLKVWVTLEADITGSGNMIERSYPAVGALRRLGFFRVRRQ